VLYPLSYEGGPGLSGRLSLSRGGRDISLKTPESAEAESQAPVDGG